MNKNVMNVPDYAKDERHIVAREIDGALYFWGAWSDEANAEQAAKEIGGVVVNNS